MSADRTTQLPRYFLDESSSQAEGTISLGPQLSTRLTRVLRVRRGDRLELVDPSNGQTHRATVVRTERVDRVDRDVVVCRIESSQPLAAPSKPRIILDAALIRPQRFDVIVEKATELGVDEIRPIRAERSRIQGDVHSRLARWRRLATEASEQSRRDRVPVLADPVDVSELETATDSLRLIASTSEAGRRISEAIDRPDVDAVHILVGPEGGWSAAEAQEARDHGWIAVTLGPRPLRAETAAIVAVALAVDCLR